MFVNAKITQERRGIIANKPIDIAYNRFYMQMRLLRTKIEKNDSEKKNISITGVVVNGNGRDAMLHYPTINIQIPAVPRSGCLNMITKSKANIPMRIFISESLYGSLRG